MSVKLDLSRYEKKTDKTLFEDKPLRRIFGLRSRNKRKIGKNSQSGAS
jgi:hypothetical protein